MNKGGILALDWGQKKVGYATCDEGGIVITPRGHFKRKANPNSTWRLSDDDLATLRSLIAQFESESLILGLPLRADGNETESSLGARELAKNLEASLKIKVTLVNEILSSWAAKDAPDEDAQAAALLIRDHLSKARSGRSVLYVIGSLILAIMAATGLYFWNQFAIKPALNSPDYFVLDVPPKSTFQSVTDSMMKEGIFINSLLFRAWLRVRGSHGGLRVGEYKIKKNWSQLHILNEILSGQPLMHKLIIKEGHSIWDVMLEWSKVWPLVPQSELIKMLRDKKNLVRMDVPENLRKDKTTTLEGFLFPETYSFRKYDSPKKLLDAMLEQFNNRGLPILKSHPLGATPEGRYRLLILASMVEKESGVFSEQPIIASVFWNRLSRGMKLQSDPTTIYGFMPDFDGNLTRAQLLTRTPWNSYTIPELPISPISNPGENALRAVVEPATTDYLYFVSKNDGTHVFSKDYKTHASFVDNYQKRRKKTPNLNTKSL
jgi:UPF0755 protein